MVGTQLTEESASRFSDAGPVASVRFKTSHRRSNGPLGSPAFCPRGGSISGSFDVGTTMPKRNLDPVIEGRARIGPSEHDCRWTPFLSKPIAPASRLDPMG